MRNLFYKLSNGTVVKTLTEAKESGQSFSPFLVEESRPPIELTDKQKARRIKI